MAKIQLAQVVVAERELAKIPKAMKVARVEVIPRLELNEVPLEEAVTTVARMLEKSAGGASGVVNVTCGTLPGAVRGRSVSLSASQAKFDDVLEAIGYSTGVQISYTVQGLALREETGSRVKYDAGDPKQGNLSAAAGKVVIERLALAEA